MKGGEGGCQAVREDRHDRLGVEDRLLREEVAVGQRRHDVAHRAVLEGEGALEELAVLGGETASLVRLLEVDVNKLEEHGAREHRGDLAAEEVVEQLGDRPRHRRGDHEEAVDDRHGVRADEQAVAGADRLRDDLSEDNDEEGGGDDADGAGAEERLRDHVELDRQHRVHQRVAEQQRAEQEVAVAAQRADALGVADLARVGGALDDDAQVLVRQAHQPQVQPREQPREEDEHDRDDHVRRLQLGRLGADEVAGRRGRGAGARVAQRAREHADQADGQRQLLPHLRARVGRTRRPSEGWESSAPKANRGPSQRHAKSSTL